MQKPTTSKDILSKSEEDLEQDRNEIRAQLREHERLVNEGLEEINRSPTSVRKSRLAMLLRTHLAYRRGQDLAFEEFLAAAISEVRGGEPLP